MRAASSSVSSTPHAASSYTDAIDAGRGSAILAWGAGSSALAEGASEAADLPSVTAAGRKHGIELEREALEELPALAGGNDVSCGMVCAAGGSCGKEVTDETSDDGRSDDGSIRGVVGPSIVD